MRLALLFFQSQKTDADETIDTAANIAEAATLLFGAAVIVGVGAEYIVPALGLIALYNWPGAAVAVGVFGEILYGLRASRLQSALTQRSKDRLREAEERLAKFAWRHLSPLEKTSLFVYLLGTRGASLAITFVAGDSEGSSFAHEIAGIFRLAGWRVGFTAGTFSGLVQTGLIVAQPGSNSVDEMMAVGAVRRAMTAAEFEYLGGFVPQWSMGAGSGDRLTETVARMYVGPKPPTE